MLSEKHVTIIFLSTVVKLVPSCFSINESLEYFFLFGVIFTVPFSTNLEQNSVENIEGRISNSRKE